MGRSPDSLPDAAQRLRECLDLHETGEALSGCRVSHLEVPADALRTMLDAAERLSCTVKHIYAEQLPNTWFVCGSSTITDRNGLPAHIDVCPAYGADFSVIYERLDTEA